ncbi:MAG: hypothetical protein ACOX8E_09740 [Ruminococcus sp.]
MKEYEVVCEAYNTCSPKPLVSVEEIETDDIEEYLKQVIPPKSSYEKTVNADGDTVYEVTSDKLRKVYIFTEI